MPSSRMKVEGRANVRIVDSTSRTPLCCRSAPITSQNHCHITANTVMFLSKTKVSTFQEDLSPDFLFYSKVSLSTSDQ